MQEASTWQGSCQIAIGEEIAPALEKRIDEAGTADREPALQEGTGGTPATSGLEAETCEGRGVVEAKMRPRRTSSQTPEEQSGKEVVIGCFRVL